MSNISSILQEIATVAETITNTQTPEASTGALLDFVVNILKHIGESSAPAQAAQQAAEVLNANKTTLATAVAANP